MKMKSVIFTTIIALMLIANSGISQTRHGTSTGLVEWSMAFNSGRASDFINDPSFAGASLTFKKFIKDNTAIGISFNWNVLSVEDENGFTELPNGAVSGAQARYLNYVPILANISYYFNDSKKNKFIPYVQANVGAYFIGQQVQLGINKIDNDNWHFGLAPEVGFWYVLGSDIMMSVNGKYNIALSSGTNLKGEDDNDYSYINANIGIGYYFR